MARYRINISAKGLQRRTVEKALDAVKAVLKNDVSVGLEEIKHPESRAERYDEAIGSISDGKGVLEELRDELQNWYDNLPENLQSGEKADALTECIENLETSIDNLETVEGESPEFPSMF